jgi:hypothetical protein
MLDVRTILRSETGFVPRTQAQALQGFSEGILGPEYYIFKAVNIHPILEEPWDTDEMDRLLAQRELDIETAEVLMTAFERMIKDPDKELALFAAESINALERRFLGRIQAFRAAISEPALAAQLRLVIREYRNLARLCFARPVLRGFYLAEALSFFSEHRAVLVDPDEDIAAFIELLLETKDRNRAERIIARGVERYPGNRRLRYLAARAAFMDRRYQETVRHLELLEPGASDEDRAAYEAVQLFWTGGACRG